MTTNAIDRITTPNVPGPTRISQATAVEQSRAIAEVQAAVVVAQQCPRSIQNAEAEMRDSCSRMALANRAFYAVPNRGNGPSVHLARELARIWGNIQYGVHELRRDDEAGESEVQAFAWDLQTNTRSTRTFVNPHARMKKVNGKQTRDPLTDLGDIYLSNQNVGARAVRECIFTVLPVWFAEEAQNICRRTLEHGEGKPLGERITDMIAAFRGIGVTVDQMEQKIGRKRGAWTAGDVAQMVITYTSITRDGLSKDEEFPPQRVTADEITGSAQPAAQAPADAKPGGRSLNDGQREAINDLAGQVPGLEDPDARMLYISQQVGREVASVNDLTNREAMTVIGAMERAVAQAEPPAGGTS